MEWLECMEAITSIVSKIEERWNYLYDEIHQTDLKQSDMLHEIEDGKFDVQRGYKKLKELQDLRKYRRQLKNEQMMLEPLYNFYKQHKGLEIELFKTKKAMESKQEQIKNWVYNPRAGEGREAE